MENKRPIKFRCWDGKSVRPIEPIKYLQDFEGLSFTNGYIDYGTFLNTDDVTLMQFIGMSDKNGVEIYEGDILISSNKAGGVVYWDDQQLKFWAGQYEPYRMADREVIGNIYENPELDPEL